MGFLSLPAESARNEVGLRLKDILSHHGIDAAARAEAISKDAADVYSDRSADPYIRSRAVDLTRFLPCDSWRERFEGCLMDEDEPVRFYCARSLAGCGDIEAGEILERFLTHRSAAVRALAASAVGRAADDLPGY